MTIYPDSNATHISSRTTQQQTYSPAENMPAAIVTHDLVRVFGQKAAVNHLNLTVNRGEFFGFLGPNGAGKSTTIKMMVDSYARHQGLSGLAGSMYGKTPCRRVL